MVYLQFRGFGEELQGGFLKVFEKGLIGGVRPFLKGFAKGFKGLMGVIVLNVLAAFRMFFNMFLNYFSYSSRPICQTTAWPYFCPDLGPAF